MEELLNTFKTELKNNIASSQFNMWLKDLNIVSLKNKNITIQTTSNFKKDWIEQHYKKIIEKIFINILNKKVNIEIIPDNSTDKQNEINKPVSTSKKKIENTLSESLNSGLSKIYSFDNFIVGQENKDAFEISKNVSDNPGKINPIFFYGNVGVGKTHLLHSIGNYISKKYPIKTIMYIQSRDFLSDYIVSLQNKTDHQFRLKYKNIDILLLDDIQFFENKEKSAMEFFYIFNDLYNLNKQMIFCCDRTPSELNNINNRLISRLLSSVIIEIEEPDYDTKYAFIDKYIKKENFDLSNNIINYLSSTMPGDIREIIGALNKLMVYQNILKNNITINNVKNILKENINSKISKKYAPEKILHATSLFFSVPIEKIKSQTKSKNLVEARQISMYLFKKYTNLSITEIGNYLGGKKHTTILYGINKIKNLLKKDKTLINKISKIIKNI